MKRVNKFIKKLLKKTNIYNLFKRVYIYNGNVVFTVEKICKYLKIDVPKKYEDISKLYVHETKLIDKLQNVNDIKENTHKSRDNSVDYYVKVNKYFREFKKKYNTQECIKNKSDVKLFEMAIEAFYTFRQYGFNYNDYFDYELYNKKTEDLPKFLNNDYRYYLYYFLNDRDTCLGTFKDKFMFNKTFSKYVSRDYCVPSRQGKDKFKKFLKRHPKFFSKPVTGTGGYGASVLEYKNNFKELYKLVVEQDLICEEIVKQHDDMAIFNDSTLNTCRLYTLLKADGDAIVTMANARFGRKGNDVDNFHCGGVSAGIDIETGVIVTDAINISHMKCDRHPDTNIVFKGYQIPMWNEAVKAVCEMAKLIPEVRHVGWDVAFTSKGKIELIEGNGMPNFDITQAVDQEGKMHRYEEHVKEWEKVLGNK